jgi:hypothetical protein
MDGSSHINIYSRGKTSLGRALSNFYYSPIPTVDGDFNSIEGYWYWLCSEADERREALRTMSGAEAKTYGRSIKAVDWRDDPAFKLRIYNAMLTKLILDDSILLEFLNNKLPFRHYYVFKDKVIEPEEGRWIIQMWEFLRQQLCS